MAQVLAILTGAKPPLDSPVYPDVTGLELSLEPAGARDPFGSPQFSMESVLYSAVH